MSDLIPHNADDNVVEAEVLTNPYQESSRLERFLSNAAHFFDFHEETATTICKAVIFSAVTGFIAYTGKTQENESVREHTAQAEKQYQEKGYVSYYKAANADAIGLSNEQMFTEKPVIKETRHSLDEAKKLIEEKESNTGLILGISGAIGLLACMPLGRPVANGLGWMFENLDEVVEDRRWNKFHKWENKNAPQPK